MRSTLSQYLNDGYEIKNTKDDELYEEAGVCDDRCKTCIYSKQWTYKNHEIGRYCDYFEMSGCERRPCPAGENCTVYTKKDIVEKSNIENDVENNLMAYKTCPDCGSRILATRQQVYCSKCIRKRVSKAALDAKKKRREELNKAEYKKIKYCMGCGKKFHNSNSSIRNCEACIEKNRHPKKYNPEIVPSTSADIFKRMKRDTKIIAIQLCYPKEAIEAICRCTTKEELGRVMHDARNGIYGDIYTLAIDPKKSRE